ncbi:domain of Kin17 curved DNA-binding protein-domain-containing protein [Lasiosphaeris hirsuta]|uniref:Domain of Kin17 curved DNA-binding protein-domain-containing protein n=1 Tax=Lasiosphaeris hirsuta TaxID=260670 RepID=A0AA40AQX9_9PEZI|nr:domain of Kin17 curved DNA-binding protein-domain-containing protein [Lasiosphaeris hirsuta]
MPKAEVGSTRHLSNQMKSRGLTRLRWYCQICEKACRDDNGFKMHCQSPSHMQKALDAGQNFKKVEESFSKAFLSEFVSQLRTGHGEKSVQANRFYQEVIARKDHVHLNSTRWHSLTDFVKHLAKESICRVEEKEGEGLFIAWIDDSPEAMRRREAVRRKEMQDKGDEEREQMILRAQIKRAQRDAEARGMALDEEDEEAKAHELKRGEGEKVKFTFGVSKSTPAISTPSAVSSGAATPKDVAVQSTETESVSGTTSESTATPAAIAMVLDVEPKKEETGKPVEPLALKPMSMKMGAKPQAKNIFKNAFAGAPKKVWAAEPKKVSEAEKIMKEEIERKRARETGGGPPNKKTKFQF